MQNHPEMCACCPILYVLHGLSPKLTSKSHMYDKCCWQVVTPGLDSEMYISTLILETNNLLFWKMSTRYLQFWGCEPIISFLSCMNNVSPAVV